MLPIGLNHMTMANASTMGVLEHAKALDCTGVELRNDLDGDLFDGLGAEKTRVEADARALRILALAEVYGFNDNTADTKAKALDLVRQARACGAQAIVLIPHVMSGPVARSKQRTLLREALLPLQTMLEDEGMTALVEPLGFANSSLRFKADVIEVFDDLDRPDCFGIIHDTFHHALSGETDFFADVTDIVHISGVDDPTIPLANMTDMHRGLVDQNDRLGTVSQMSELLKRGYDGPFSFEAFAPALHALTDPTTALSASTAFINSHVATVAA